MKRVSYLIFAVVLFLVPAGAFGATLSYSPSSYSLTLQPGQEHAVPFTVTLNDSLGNVYYLWFLDRVENGNLPPEWITSAKSTTFLGSWSPSASTELKVSVPGETEPGTYSGYVFSKAMRSHGYADPGDGMYLEVIVPANCSAVPQFEIVSFGPSVLWPPDHSTQVVSITGRVIAPEGCSVFEAGYSIDDEYGEYTALGTIEIGMNGDFSIYLPVEASREGSDKDGRLYTITLYAEDEAGIGEGASLQVLVPHDQGNR